MLVQWKHRVMKGREGSNAADSSVPWPGRLSAVQDLPPDAPAAATPQPVTARPAATAAPDAMQAAAPNSMQPVSASDTVTAAEPDAGMTPQLRAAAPHDASAASASLAAAAEVGAFGYCLRLEYGFIIPSGLAGVCVCGCESDLEVAPTTW